MGCALSDNRWDLFLYLLLAFEALLRPGEVCNLLREDLRLPSEYTFGNKRVVIVAITAPKTRRRSAKIQHVLLRNDALTFHLECFCRGKAPETRLFPPYPKVRTAVHGYLSSLGLPLGIHTLGGLRAGGATHRYVNDEAIDRIMRMGRWTNIRTLDHYLQEAACHLSTLSWSELAHRRVNAYARVAHKYLQSPMSVGAT